MLAIMRAAWAQGIVFAEGVLQAEGEIVGFESRLWGVALEHEVGTVGESDAGVLWNGRSEVGAMLPSHEGDESTSLGERRVGVVFRS